MQQVHNCISTDGGCHRQGSAVGVLFLLRVQSAQTCVRTDATGSENYMCKETLCLWVHLQQRVIIMLNAGG